MGGSGFCLKAKMLRVEANPFCWRLEDAAAQTGQYNLTSFQSPATEGQKDDLKKCTMRTSNILLLYHLILVNPLHYHSNNLQLRGKK